MLCIAVPELSDIQDAYVIAVEDQARRRLEQLSALHKVQTNLGFWSTFSVAFDSVGYFLHCPDVLHL